MITISRRHSFICISISLPEIRSTILLSFPLLISLMHFCSNSVAKKTGDCFFRDVFVCRPRSVEDFLPGSR